MTWRYAENLHLKYPPESLLGRIEPSSWTELNRLWTRSDYHHGQVILAAEEPTTEACFLLHGTARATIFTEAGREVSFLHLSKGDCFGEFSAIDEAPRSASVVATGECTAARMSSGSFRKILRSNADLSFALTGILVGKLRALSQRISDFNAFSADERVRREVLRLAKANAGVLGSASIDHPPTQTELAAFVFTNREGVAREMGRMKRAGVLERRGRGLHFPSIALLETYNESQSES